MTSDIVRYVLSAALLVGVYSESGLWTTLAIGLLFVAAEAEGYEHQRRRAFERRVADAMKAFDAARKL